MKRFKKSRPVWVFLGVHWVQGKYLESKAPGNKSDPPLHRVKCDGFSAWFSEDEGILTEAEYAKLVLTA